MCPEAAFLRACMLDVTVRKPGNVSLASPGHGMQADQFIAAAQAACGPLFARGASVGERIERAMSASLSAAGCNTNLGIVLLAAPIAAASERAGALGGPAALRRALDDVLAALDLDDARAAFRAIAAARPGGLGSASAQDVHDEPSVDLRSAMVLAAARDSIARQYANGFVDLFETCLAKIKGEPQAAAVLGIYLSFLARWPDSHIVRKHGEAVAQTVMSTAQGFVMDGGPGREGALAEWDEFLKAQAINPGTSADLTVATLLLALLWHGS
jgi:triphosphoribosyl-dephospho-CoA synthase